MTRRNMILGTAASSAVVIVGTLLSGIIVARLLGPEGRGDYGLLILVAQLGFGLGTLSFFDAAVISGKKRAKPQFYAPVLALAGLCIATLSVIAALILLEVLGDISTFGGLVIIALVVFMIVESINRALYSIELAAGNYAHVNWERVIAVLGFTLITIALIYWGIHSLIAVFAGFIASKLPIFVMRLLRFQADLRRRFSRPFFWRTGKAGLALHLPYSISLFAAQIDKVFIAGFFGSAEFGFYLVCQSTVGVFFSIPIQVISLVALPEFSEKDRDAARLKFEKTFRLLILLTVLTAVIAVLLAQVLIPSFFGVEYVPAVAFALPVAVLMIGFSLRTVLAEYLRAQRQWRLQTGLEVSIITLSLMAAVLSGGTIFAFLGAINLAYLVSILAVLILLSRKSGLVSLPALQPDLSEGLEVIKLLWRARS